VGNHKIVYLLQKVVNGPVVHDEKIHQPVVALGPDNALSADFQKMSDEPAHDRLAVVGVVIQEAGAIKQYVSSAPLANGPQLIDIADVGNYQGIGLIPQEHVDPNVPLDLSESVPDKLKALPDGHFKTCRNVMNGLPFLYKFVVNAESVAKYALYVGCKRAPFPAQSRGQMVSRDILAIPRLPGTTYKFHFWPFGDQLY
jgi:hypothetical protein